MKLSTKRKIGAVHVRGRRILRVSEGHTVKDHLGDELAAMAGDMAIEVVHQRVGGVVGYSYISGRGMGRFSTAARPTQFGDEVKLAFIDEEMGVWPDDEEELLADLKAIHDENEIVFGYNKFPSQAMAATGGMTIQHWWSKIRGENSQTHLVLLLQWSKKGGMLLHWQPAKDAHDKGMSVFQARLIETIQKAKRKARAA